ncbi:uncharacterized protein LOC126900775 [Daktulosphaira vitifoliae]|uniref:uncharacterized protein LOC126900775 n=1 Tax=Daktulosphaira vitifoliae TaxID=58002 RepID=UPI0021AA2485|nr:uncharacterized protein LOC126900775 [Daktulosphaira vitifoliae]
MDIHRKIKKLRLNGIKHEYSDYAFGNCELDEEKFVSVDIHTNNISDYKPKNLDKKFVLSTSGILDDLKCTNLSNSAKNETSIEFSSGDQPGKIDKVNNWVKSAVELHSSYVLKTPAMSLDGGDHLDIITENTIEEFTCPEIGQLIKKYDNFFYVKNQNSSTKYVHNNTVWKKTLGCGDHCDKKMTLLNVNRNQKVDFQPVINGSQISKKPNTFLETEHRNSDDKIDLENTRSSPYKIYSTFPFRDMSNAVFKRTPSSRLRKLIEKFDNFFCVKNQNSLTNEVPNNTVWKKTLGCGDCI